MEVIFTDNITKKLLDVMKPNLCVADEVKFGVAFVKYSGFSLLESDIKNCLKNNGKIEFILGLDFRTTDPNVMKVLYDITNSEPNLKMYCFSDPSIKDTPVYHPKLYLIRKRKEVVISVGSSNLTAGGLKDNVEVNIVIKTNVGDEIISDIYGIYNKLKFQKGLFSPDLGYIEEYKETYKNIHKRNIQTFKETWVNEKIRGLKKKEKQLPKPKPTKSALFGWQRLVYDRLPDGVFETSDIYNYEDELQRSYPENKHVRDKIRQILQQLRDLGLLKYISKNRWSKI